MSSRDGSDRTNRPRRSRQSNPNVTPPRRTPPASQSRDVDPADIDRYLSGRPSREEQGQAEPRARRPRQPSGTADQLNQLQRTREGAARQRPSQRPTRPATPGRQQFAEPAPQPEADEWYEDDEAFDDATSPYGAYEEDQADIDPTPTIRQRRQPRATRSTYRAPRPAEPVYDDEYDDELYNDDPFLTYADDDEEWEAAPPRRAAKPKPQVKLNRPNMPKFTMPASISQAEIVNDIPSLAMIGSMLLSAAVMAIVVSNRLNVLPEIIPTHISASGVQENLRGRNAIWSVPLLAFALSLMNLGAAWFIARVDMFASRFLLGAMLLVQFIAWIAVLEYLW